MGGSWRDEARPVQPPATARSDWHSEATEAIPYYLADDPEARAPAPPADTPIPPSSPYHGVTRETHPELYGEVPPAPPGPMQSFLGSALDAATFGLADEAGARLLSWLPGQDQSYEELRDRARQRLEQMREHNPAASTAGAVTGGAASLLVPGLGVAGGVARGAGTTARALRTGAAVGGLSGYGHSEAEHIGGQVRDTAIGAGLGAGLAGTAAGVGAGVGAGLRAARRGAMTAAGAQRARQLGANMGDIGRIGRSPGGLSGFAERLQRHGIARQALRQGVGENMRRADALSRRGADLMKQALGRASQRAKVDPSRLADRVRSDLLDEMSGNPFADTVRGSIQQTLKQLSREYPEGIPLERAQAIKQWLQREVYGTLGPRGQDTPASSAMRQLSGIINREIEDTIENAGQALGNRALASDFLRGKEMFRTARQAMDLLTREQARTAANRVLGLTDTIGAGAGFVATGGNPLGAIGGAIANRATRGVEKPLGATIAERVARIGAPAASRAGRAAQTLTSGTRRAIGRTAGIKAAAAAAEQRAIDQSPGAVLPQVVEQSPQSLGPYASLLESARQRGPEALAQTHFQLMETDQQYREIIDQLEDLQEATQ